MIWSAAKHRLILARTGKPVSKRVRSIWYLLLALLGSAGCASFSETVPSTSWLKRPRLGRGLDERIVLLEVAILERPIGDPYINKELWQNTDEMIVDLDRKAAVEDNGFRVGQIVGMTPGKLQDLLKSKRYCGNPWRRLLPSGNTASLYLARPGRAVNSPFSKAASRPNWASTRQDFASM